ncbi:MAG: Hpt domain-containing protein [Victivallaceae bacterium]|nr:Hpt domain-containing protein [Victivallaceae bacterium]
MPRKPIMNYMREFLGITGQDADDLFDCFIESFEELCQKLESAIEQRDVMEIRRVTHSIIGSSSNLGCEDISQHAMDINTAAKSNDFEHMHQPMQKLKEHLEIFRSCK